MRNMCCGIMTCIGTYRMLNVLNAIQILNICLGDVHNCWEWVPGFVEVRDREWWVTVGCLAAMVVEPYPCPTPLLWPWHDLDLFPKGNSVSSCMLVRMSACVLNHVV